MKINRYNDLHLVKMDIISLLRILSSHNELLAIIMNFHNTRVT